MSRLIASIIQPLRLFTQSIHLAGQGPAVFGNSLVQPSNYLLSTIRTKVRCYFPRPNEVRRVRRHGWKTRISTPNGRKTIMRRLLKGRYVLTH